LPILKLFYLEGSAITGIPKDQRPTTVLQPIVLFRADLEVVFVDCSNFVARGLWLPVVIRTSSILGFVLALLVELHVLNWYVKQRDNKIINWSWLKLSTLLVDEAIEHDQVAVSLQCGFDELPYPAFVLIRKSVSHQYLASEGFNGVAVVHFQTIAAVD
jgi:hypothetical protein